MVYVKCKEVGILILCLLVYWILGKPGTFKYVFILTLSLFFVFLKRLSIQKKYLVILVSPIIYLVVGGINILINRHISLFTLKELAYLLIPAISAACIFSALDSKRTKRIMQLQFWTLAAMSIISSDGFSVQNLFESQYAYVLGAYVIYFFYIKEKRYFFWALVFMFLAHKRIVMAAVLVILLLYTVINNTKKKYYKTILAVIPLLVIIICYLWVFMVREGLIHNIFLNLQIESWGRIYVWSAFNNSYDFDVRYIGRGIGYVAEQLSQMYTNYPRLHNDILLLFIECGFWGFGLYLFSNFYIVKVVSHHVIDMWERKGILLCLVIYTFVNYLTDNILIYINYWLPLYMIILQILYDEPQVDISS